MRRKTGARGLRTIMEDILLDTMYEIPSYNKTKKIVVNKAFVEKQSKPFLVFSSSDQKDTQADLDAEDDSLLVNAD
jgi:ATP-dependent Clp protease ATP-binding subunit ClpX